MAKLRDLKKQIRLVCGDLATDALIAKQMFPTKVDGNQVDAIINEIAALQGDTLALCNIKFDKGRKAFADSKTYRKARYEYFAVAYNKLKKDFLERANSIVDQLNAVVPQEAREAVTNA